MMVFQKCLNELTDHESDVSMLTSSGIFDHKSYNKDDLENFIWRVFITSNELCKGALHPNIGPSFYKVLRSEFKKVNYFPT